MSLYRIERDREGRSEHYNPDTMRWSSQVFASRTNPVTLMSEDYVLCNVWGRTREECAENARRIIYALTAQGTKA